MWFMPFLFANALVFMMDGHYLKEIADINLGNIMNQYFLAEQTLLVSCRHLCLNEDALHSLLLGFVQRAAGKMFHLNEGRALEEKKVDEVDYDTFVDLRGDLEIGVKEDEDVDDCMRSECKLFDVL